MTLHPIGSAQDFLNENQRLKEILRVPDSHISAAQIWSFASPKVPMAPVHGVGRPVLEMKKTSAPRSSATVLALLRHRARGLQGAKKLENLDPILGEESLELIPRRLSLSAMEEDCLAQGRGAAVVKIGRRVCDAPESRCDKEIIERHARAFGETCPHIVPLQV